MFGLSGLLVNFFRFELRYFDPFLVLDEFSGGLYLLSSVLCFFMNSDGCSWLWSYFIILLFVLAVTAPAGFPDHPHRGLMILLSSSFWNLLYPMKLASDHDSNNRSSFSSSQGSRQWPTCCRYVRLSILALGISPPLTVYREGSWKQSPVLFPCTEHKKWEKERFQNTLQSLQRWWFSTTLFSCSCY